MPEDVSRRKTNCEDTTPVSLVFGGNLRDRAAFSVVKESMGEDAGVCSGFPPSYDLSGEVLSGVFVLEGRGDSHLSKGTLYPQWSSTVLQVER
jgi:hypothetical protein